jgi:glycosyltransferase involved in cell wall biosynthesis
MTTLAVIILTFNEEIHLGRALDSIRECANEVFVVDSGSTDRTLEIAAGAGAQVLVHPFINQADQFTWALRNCPVTADWVMRLDADELLEADLSIEITTRLPLLPRTISGVNLKRKHIFMGRWIRHGGRYPVTLLRIWRRGCAEVEARWMDEHMLLTSGTSTTFQGGFADHNLNDLDYFTSKHNAYATREAVDVLLTQRGIQPADRSGPTLSSWNARSKRAMKSYMYNRMPFWMSAPCYFALRYFVLLGFLDGVEGFVYHFLQGFWYRVLVGARVVELDRLTTGLRGDEQFLLGLSSLTGLPIRRPIPTHTSARSA